VKEFAAECRLRCRYCRLEPGRIANAGRAAIPLDLLSVDFKVFIQEQEERLHLAASRSFSKRLECFAVSLVR
jgi:hypothetical protein